MQALARFSVLQGPHSGETHEFALRLVQSEDVPGELLCNSVVVIGRSPGTAVSGNRDFLCLALPQDKEASSAHAQLEFTVVSVLNDMSGSQHVSVSASLLDLASTNGTRVNAACAAKAPAHRKGKPQRTLSTDDVIPSPLNVGDVVKIGASFLSFDELSVATDLPAKNSNPAAPSRSDGDVVHVLDDDSEDILEDPACPGPSSSGCTAEKAPTSTTEHLSSCFVCNTPLTNMTLLVSL